MQRTTDFSGLGYYTPEEMAQTLAFLAGLTLLILGALRLGWLVNWIPKTAIDAFATAASLKLIIGQLPVLLGIIGVSNMDSSYIVLANVIRYIFEINVDAAFGLLTIVFLAVIGVLCTALAQRYPSQRRLWSFICTLRFPVVIGFSILISYLVCQDCFWGNTSFQIVGATIEPGFLRAHAPKLPRRLEISRFWPQIPPIVLMLAVSQAAMVTKLAESDGYTVNVSQELIALGVINVFGPSLGGYLTMGSFSSSRILSMAGSRSQLAGVFAASMLVIALYFLMGAFAFTPLGSLAGIVIYSMSTNLPLPKALYKNWRLQPTDFVIWTISVAIALAYSLEWSLYVGTILEILLQLPRLVFPPARETETMAEVPSPGVFIYHFGRSFFFVNKWRHLSLLSAYIRENTILKSPTIRLQAIVLDLRGVHYFNTDIAQGLRSLRRELRDLTEADDTKWCCVFDPDIRRSLVLVDAGFDVDTQYENVEAAMDELMKSG